MKLDKLKCGNCGCETVMLAHRGPEDGTRVGGGPTFEGQLVVTCAGCGAVTIIGTSPPKFTVEWGDGSPGIHCGGWRS